MPRTRKRSEHYVNNKEFLTAIIAYKDEVALAEKTRALKELAQLYPDVNPLWREWVYDVCVNTPPDQLEAMKRRIAVNPGKHANPCGGVLQTA